MRTISLIVQSWNGIPVCTVLKSPQLQWLTYKLIYDALNFWLHFFPTFLQGYTSFRLNSLRKCLKFMAYRWCICDNPISNTCMMDRNNFCIRFINKNGNVVTVQCAKSWNTWQPIKAFLSNEFHLVVVHIGNCPDYQPSFWIPSYNELAFLFSVAIKVCHGWGTG